jgi:hypothetical protein
MTALVESPWPVLFIGIVVEAALALALLKTGRGKLLGVMIGVGALTLLGLAVERLVVTDREAVSDTLDAAAAAVEANDLERLLSYISPTAQRPQADSRFVLGRFEVSKARVRDLTVTINRLTSPPTAKARFIAFGQGRDRQGVFPYQAYSQQVIVELQLEGDRWLVTDYSVEDILPPRK